MCGGRATTNSFVSLKQFPKMLRPMAKIPKGNAGPRYQKHANKTTADQTEYIHVDLNVKSTGT